MNRLLKLLLPLTLTFLCPIFAKAQITLDECVKLAEQNYPQIKQLGLIDETASYDMSNVNKSWLPQVTVSGKASYQSEVVEMPFEMPGFSFDMPHDQYSIIAEISQTIWDGGMSHNQKDVIKTGSDVQRKQTEVALYSLRDRVQKIYLSILLADAQLEQNAILIQSLERNAAQAKACIENGTAYKSDLDMIRVNILVSEQQKTDLSTMREAYVKMLETFTGKSLQNVELTLPQDDTLFSYSQIARPELALYDARMHQNMAQLKMLNANISPKFSLAIQGGYGRPGLNMLKNEFQPYWTAGIRMQWNLGALYTRKGDKRKLDTQLRQIESERETFLFNTDLEVKEKRAAIEKYEKMIAGDDEIIALRQSIREAGQEQYANGTITMGELMKRIDDEHNAMSSKVIHQIQLAMAVCALRNALGE